MTESRYEIGMKVRKEVLGSEYVERAQARTTVVYHFDIILQGVNETVFFNL